MCKRHKAARGIESLEEGGQSVSGRVWGVARENAGMAGRDQIVQTHIKAFSFCPEDNGESLKKFSAGR